ncbi:MAG: hypothetical protein LH647_14380 [Leptolyngbyaceae cyanobacterium CAN_BIN12]|nr:hypothetical protein [Leptolyngbyaceae cyanobacterium CAN_BIN12]
MKQRPIQVKLNRLKCCKGFFNFYLIFAKTCVWVFFIPNNFYAMVSYCEWSDRQDCLTYSGIR